jgi:hypothetical protein
MARARERRPEPLSADERARIRRLVARLGDDGAERELLDLGAVLASYATLAGPLPEGTDLDALADDACREVERSRLEASPAVELGRQGLGASRVGPRLGPPGSAASAAR